MKTELRSILLLAAGVSAIPVDAHISFRPYSGSQDYAAIAGATSVRHHGIDWWTNGVPNRPYKIIGFLHDDRNSLLLSGKALGSSAVAQSVLSHGGNAVILLRENSKLIELLNNGKRAAIPPYPGRLGRDWREARMERDQVRQIYTRFAVIRYR